MPGAARQQVTLFCIAQNTSNQTKGHPAAPALWATFGLTVKLGGCATRPSGVHTPHPTAELRQCSPSSQFVRQTEAAQKGFQVLWAEPGIVLGALPAGRAGRGGLVLLFCPLGPPPSSTAGPGDFGEDCLRPQAEFRSRPVRRAAQGRRIGAAFFGYLSLAV